VKVWNYVRKSVVILGDGCALISGIAACLMGVMLAANTVARYAFNSPWPFGEEYTAYMLVAITFFPLAYTMRKKGHIRIELALARLPARVRHWVIIAYTVTAIIVVAIMTYYGLELAVKSFKSNIKAVTVVQTPLWIPQMFIVVGLVVFGLQLVLYLISRFRWLREGRAGELSTGL